MTIAEGVFLMIAPAVLGSLAWLGFYLIFATVAKGLGDVVARMTGRYDE